MAGTEIAALEHASGGDQVMTRRLMDVMHSMLIDEGKRCTASEVVARAKDALLFCM